MNTILINIEELLKLHYSNVYCCFFIRKKNLHFFIWLFGGRLKPEENKRKKKSFKTLFSSVNMSKDTAHPNHLKHEILISKLFKMKVLQV